MIKEHSKPESSLTKRLFTQDTLRAAAFLVVSLTATSLLLLFRDDVKLLGNFGYAGAFALAFTGNALVAVPFPWIFPVAAMGAVYSPLWITLVAALGAAVGELVPYLLGHSLSRAARSSALAARLASLSRIKKTLVLMALAFSPILSYPGLAAGILRYPIWATFAMTLVAEGFKVWLFINGVSFIDSIRLP